MKLKVETPRKIKKIFKSKLTIIFLSFRELSEENYKDNKKNLKNLNRRDGIGCTLLFWVVYTEDIERVKYLLSIGAFPNISNYFGETPLHIAVMKNNKMIVNELLQYGAEINIENIYGETPRFYAYRNKNSDEIIKKKYWRALKE